MSERVTTDGRPEEQADLSINPTTGQQKDYICLSAEERAKGFVRPVRHAYVHVGRRPKHPLRDLTPEERARYTDEEYVKYEEYPPEGSVVGRFWTMAELQSGCGMPTRMSAALSETYAREPHFYGATFCTTCRAHFPVGATGEFVWAGTDERVGTQYFQHLAKKKHKVLDDSLTEFKSRRTVGESIMLRWLLTSSEQQLHHAVQATCVRAIQSDRLAKPGYPTFGTMFNPEVGT